MSDPRPGDFGLQRGSGLAMFLVRVGTLSRYGHACLAVGDAVDGMVPIVEAMPEGVRLRMSRTDEWAWSDLPLSTEQRQNIASGARTDVGKPYDWPSIAGFVIRHWWSKFRGQSPDHPDTRLMCSEEVAWRYEINEWDLYPRRAPNTISPGDLAPFLPAGTLPPVRRS